MLLSPPLHLQDVVETHLLREIAVRSDNFFEAASVVADLRASLLRTYQQVVGLRSTVAAVDADVVHAADTVQVTPCPITVVKVARMLELKLAGLLMCCCTADIYI